MPGLQPLSADVRFREIDLSQVIRSASASVGAILLVSKKGRLGTYTVNDSKMFKDEYGIPDASVSFAHYCALNALTEMNTLRCVRVAGAGYKYSAAIIKDNGSGVTLIEGVTGGVVDPENPEWDDLVTGAEEALLLVTPKSGPGSYGDALEIDITSQNLDTPAAPLADSVNTGGTLVSASYEYRISAISELGETLASPIVTEVIGGSVTTASITLTWTPVPGARGYHIYGRSAGNVNRIGTVGRSTFTFVDDGSVTPDTDFPPVTNPADLPEPTNVFTLRVFDTNVSSSNPVEEWELTLEDFTDGNGVQLEAEQRVNAFSEYINITSHVSQLLVPVPTIVAADREALIDGDSGAAPTNGALSLAWEEHFGDPELSQVNILINGGYTDVGVQQTMLRIAAQRGDATAILDTPSDMQTAERALMHRQLNLNANSNYGAIYTPDIMVDDPDNGKRLYVPPSGWMAAVYARTDRVAGPQFQPAGLNRGLIDALQQRYEYSEPQRNALYAGQVNYIRRFIGEGTAIFEASTLQAKQSALSWISVRRMLNVIKTSCRQFLMYSVHEPNDDFTRRQIITAVSDYLSYWRDARGILDFQVIADESNNPPAKYNLGILQVTIFITPIIPVHQIEVDIVVTKAGMDWSEINIANLG